MAWLHVARGLRLLCPSCGRAPLYQTFLQAHDTCPACGRRHAADRGDWTGGAEITLLLTSGVLIALFLALRTWTTLSGAAHLALLSLVAVVMVPLVYRRVKGAWLGVVRAWEGDAPRPSPVRDPAWFTDLWEREAEGAVDEPRVPFRW